MNWNSPEEVAEVAAAKYDLCIASDVAYTAVQLLHRPTLSATPSAHTRSSPTLSRSPTTRLTSRPSQPRCALSELPPRHRRADPPVRRARTHRGRAQV